MQQTRTTTRRTAREKHLSEFHPTTLACRAVLALIALMLAVGAAVAGTVRLDGPMKQGGLVQGHTEAGTKIEFGGRVIRVSKDGVFLIGFGRDAPPETRLRITYADGSREWRVLKIAQRKYRVQRIDDLPPDKVTPREQDLVRIRSDIALIKKARTRDDARTDFLSGFIWPVTGRITGVYGSQRILNGKPRRPHYGLDIAAPTGTPVLAPADGIVTLAHPDMFYTGVTMIIDHGQGLSSTFSHLSRLLVKEGARVRQGDPVAEVGATGRVHGAHLDWRINLFAERLDPKLALESMSAAETRPKIQETSYK